MKITKRQLRRIIKEELSRHMAEGILYLERLPYGGLALEDEAGEELSIGQLVRSLLDAGIHDFASSPAAIDKILASDAEGVQGGVEYWDPDVIAGYGVDLDVVVQLYAKEKNLQIEEVA
tara:strand:- start:192 stop:548 length:357 start_codon:yes stop_codon:yes gene_type:complete